MKTLILWLLLAVAATAQTHENSTGKWNDLSKDSSGMFFLNSDGSSASTKTLINEDYEVLRTHEVCATVYGYFMEKSQQGRYNVNFHGMRTTATFTFTTQYDAEHWVQKFCTPECLLQIKSGRSVLARNY